LLLINIDSTTQDLPTDVVIDNNVMGTDRKSQIAPKSAFNILRLI